MPLRRAFTIMELLIVITIVGLLVAMLLPAINYARESARQVKCRNRLHQIGVSINQYLDVRGVFPGYYGEQFPAGVNFPPSDDEPRGRFGPGGGRRRGRRNGVGQTMDSIFEDGTWLVQTMPYMEESSLYEILVDIHQNPDLEEEVMRRAVGVPVTTYYCPSRRSADAYPLHGRYQRIYGALGARTDYAMNGGSSNSPGRQASISRRGVWDPGKRVKAQQVKDGLSKTYLVGEKAMEADLYTTGLDRGDKSPVAGLVDQFGAANSYVRFATRTPSPDRVNNCLACHDFGSAHPISWNMLLCDGSVHAMGYDIVIDVHRAFASVDGEEEDSPIQ